MVEDMASFFREVLGPVPPPADRPPIKTDWGTIRIVGNSVELNVQKPPSNGTIDFPRLNNPIGAVYVQDDDNKKPLGFKPGIAEWQITLPPSVPAETTIVVETVGTPYFPSLPRVVSATDAAITLAAHDAVVSGKLLRYEPQPHKNTLGYWANEKDFCEWSFYTDRPGRYDVNVLQGCGKGQGGSRVAVRLGDEQVEFVVEDTGHFQNFKERNVGSLTIGAAGVYTLRIQPISKAANAVMDVRRVRLAHTGS
jgi:hypothetical protein